MVVAGGMWTAGVAYALGMIVFIIVLHTEHDKGSPICCKWKSPGLHPVLMTLAFGLLGPWASMAYGTLETVLGLTHAQAKACHGALHTLAFMMAWLGFASKYLGSAAGGVAHFRSVHSLIGMVVLVGYTVQWLVGATVFAVPAVDPALKRAVHSVHGQSGLTLMVLSLGTIVTGALTYVGKSSDASYAQQNFDNYAAVSFLVIILGCLVAYVGSRPKPVAPGGGIERAQLLASTGRKGGWP
mmetsp:Transcript_31240/g.81905  ORF Transcript_31240/g.81905 Transcript_31240/m.81905 type:complete len:241 (-) Transcript_31240:28-750(-)